MKRSFDADKKVKVNKKANPEIVGEAARGMGCGLPPSPLDPPLVVAYLTVAMGQLACRWLTYKPDSRLSC